MINKSFLYKIRVFSIMIFGLVLLISSDVIAVASPISWKQESVTVAKDKVWNIKFNRQIKTDNLSGKVKVYNPMGIQAPVDVSYANNTITIKPPVAGYISGQTYSLQIYETITDLDSFPLKAAVTMSFTIAVPNSSPLINTSNKSYFYSDYANTLDQIVDIQSKVSPVNVVANYYLTPSKLDIYQYMNPKNFENHDYAIYQFLKLNYIEGITAEELDGILLGKGILSGQGKTFLDACNENNINPAYVIAHAMLETGNGSSLLANGVLVSDLNGVPVSETKLTYNMFGIGARDANADKLGAEKAYTEGWFTPELAIQGGIKWISSQYINHETHKQNTLYEMRWNPSAPLIQTNRHQYATDIAWAYKQSYRIKEIINGCTNANLVFEIPKYK